MIAKSTLFLSLTLSIFLSASAVCNHELLGHWTFERGEELKDRSNHFGPIKLNRGAFIREGVLNTNRIGWAVAGSYKGPLITAKTLVSWVAFNDFNYQKGSVLTIDRLSGDEFDAIVLGEIKSRKWLSGSSYHRRTVDPSPGYTESMTNTLIQMAISYKLDSNGRLVVHLYRNGEQIGTYSKGSLATWKSNDAEVFWGIRHGTATTGGPGFLNVKIEESRIYNGALSAADLKKLTPIKKYTLLGQFTFEKGEEMKDRVGKFGNVILKGATIANGQLDLGPRKWAASPSYTGPTIYEKTLVSWVSIDSLATQRGSVLTIDKKTKDQFDAIVLGERQRSRWMAGSSHFRRTLDAIPGFMETQVNKMFQIAITYEKAGNGQAHIRLYRNGVKIGDYTRGPFVNWPAGDAELFWGIRTGSVNHGGPDAVDAHIEESRIYAGVLNEFDLKSLTPVKADNCEAEQAEAALSNEMMESSDEETYTEQETAGNVHEFEDDYGMPLYGGK